MIQPGNPAPVFELATPEGRRVSLEAACSLGPVLVVFFKSSCPTCQLTVPAIEKAHQALAGAGLTVFGISQDDAAETAAFVASKGLTFRVLLDGPDWPVSRAWNVTSVPTLFLVGKDQQVWEAFTGWSRAEMNSMAATAARMVGAPVAPVSPEDDGTPAWRPG